MALLQDLLFSRPAARSWHRALAYSIAVLVAIAGLYGDVSSGAPPVTQGGHAEISLNLALNAHFCGASPRLSTAFSVGWLLTGHPELMETPFVTILARQAGSLEAYCRSVTQSFRNNENSLMWLMRAVLWARPGGSPAALGRWLARLRLAILFGFSLALLRAGASVWLATAAALVGCAILRALELRYTAYPFLLTSPLLLIAHYTIAVTVRRIREPRFLSGIAATGGFLAAFAANMRTSQLPMAVALFPVFLRSVCVQRRQPSCAVRSRASRHTVALSVIAFVAGYALFDQIFIGPLRTSDGLQTTNSTNHAFAHPLVLGLGYPDTALSRAEGISWDDQVGLKLAQRVMPDVTYLGPSYERALLKYYGRLWKKRAGLMADAYWQKLKSAGSEVFLSAALIGSQFGMPRGPALWLHRVTDGLVLIAACTVVFVWALWRHLRTGSPMLLALSLLGLTGLLTLVESFLTLSLFVAMYYSVLLFVVFFTALWLVQQLADSLERSAGVRPTDNRVDG